MVTNTQHMHTQLHLHHVLTCTQTHLIQIFLEIFNNSLFTKTTFKTMATPLGKHINVLYVII
jgi:hypothetical protein